MGGILSMLVVGDLSGETNLMSFKGYLVLRGVGGSKADSGNPTFLLKTLLVTHR